MLALDLPLGPRSSEIHVLLVSLGNPAVLLRPGLARLESPPVFTILATHRGLVVLLHLSHLRVCVCVTTQASPLEQVSEDHHTISQLVAYFV